MPQCDADSFQIFLQKLSEQDPNELKIMILDNGAFHKAKKLVIPDNIILIFLPPYSPELNPAEKIWAKFKRQFTNQFFKTIEDLEKYVCTLCKKLNGGEVKSICAYQYIFAGNFWSNI